jgi:hypothetical protein
MERVLITLLVILIILLALAHWQLITTRKTRIRKLLIDSFGDDMIVNTPVKNILKFKLYA